MKKLLIVMSLVLSLSIALVGCSKPATDDQSSMSQESQQSQQSQQSQAEIQIPEFEFVIEGAGDITKFTSNDAAKLTYTEIETSVTNKNGETTVSVYGGVLLKDLLASIGVTDLTTLTIEASDGYQVVYEKDLAFADDVIVGWSKDGQPMENSQINISPAKASGKTLAKMAVKLIVE